MPVRSCTFLLNTHWYYAIFKYPRCYNIIYRTCIYSMISCYHAQKTVNIFWVLHCTKMVFLGRGDSLCTGCVEVGLTKTPAPLPPPTHTLRDHSKNITGGGGGFWGGHPDFIISWRGWPDFANLLRREHPFLPTTNYKKNNWNSSNI